MYQPRTYTAPYQAPVGPSPIQQAQQANDIATLYQMLTQCMEKLDEILDVLYDEGEEDSQAQQDDETDKLPDRPR